MFSSDFYLRVIKGLGLKISDAETVKLALGLAENDNDLENAVISTIEDLEENCQLLNAERSSPNSALIKADVLEWSEGNRSQGMVIGKRELQQQLANLLGLDWAAPSYPGGTTILDTNTKL